MCPETKINTGNVPRLPKKMYETTKNGYEELDLNFVVFCVVV